MPNNDTDDAAPGTSPPPAQRVERQLAPGVLTDAAYDDLVEEATRRTLAHLAAHDAERDADPLWEALDPFHAIRHPARRAYLRALASCGNTARAARIVGIDRTTVYSRPWREDRAFQEALPLAKKLGAELLELEAQRRAVEGDQVAVGWYQGRPGGYERRYSDGLLLALLKANDPERFGEKLRVSGSLSSIDWGALPDEAIERIRRGEHPAVVLGAVAQKALEAGSERRDAGPEEP